MFREPFHGFPFDGRTRGELYDSLGRYLPKLRISSSRAPPQTAIPRQLGSKCAA